MNLVWWSFSSHGRASACIGSCGFLNPSSSASTVACEKMKAGGSAARRALCRMFATAGVCLQKRPRLSDRRLQLLLQALHPRLVVLLRDLQAGMSQEHRDRFDRDA